MLGQRLDAGRVFQLVQADDVSIQTGQRGQQFRALAGELVRLVAVPAAALHILSGPHLLSSGLPVG